MQGYPLAARRLAQLPQQPQHLADGGAVGFGARGLSGLRDLVPKMQAMGYPQAAPAPAPAPEARGTAALRAMIPQVEAMGYRQASAGQPQYFAEGGVVRGPGTGTSDSIEDEVEPGTFIMPADSTQAIGPSALEQMGTVPVRLSDGEFKVPPEQVMAIGEAVLKLMKDTTHAPVNGVDGGQTDEEVAQAQGFSPSAAQRMQELPQFADGGVVGYPVLGLQPQDDGSLMGFADGGTVERDVTRVGNSYSGMNVGGNITVNGQAPQGSFSENPGSRLATPPAVASMGSMPAPAAAKSVQVVQPPAGQTAPTPGVPAAPAPATAQAAAPAAPMGWAERNAQRNLEVTASSIMDSPARRAAQASLAAPPPAAPARPALAAPAPAPTPLTAAVQPATQQLGTMPTVTQNRSVFQPRSFADGGTVQDDLQARLAQIPAGGPAGWTGGGLSSAAAPAAPSPVAAAAPPAPSGALSRAASYVAPAPAQSLAAQAMSAPPQARPLNDQPVATQNIDAAQSLASRGAAGVLAQMPNAPQQGVQTPTIRHSGNDWQARKDLENARTSAMSITANGGRFDRNRGMSPERAEYMALLGTDQALRGSAPGLALQGMKEQGDTQRAGQQVAASSANAAADRMGAMDRTLITERGNNSRAGIAAQAGMEEARIKAAEGNKPPAGYRWAAGGKLEPIPGGPAADGKPLTEDQAKSAGYALRMDNALKLIDDVGKTNPGAIRPGAIEAATNALPETLANSLRPEARQRVEAAQLDALDAALTLNTGAAYTREQLQGLSRSYFAQPGDDDKTVSDKGNRLQSLIDTARLRAGEKGAAMTDTAQAKNAARTGGTPAAATPALPGGMTRQVGTSGGRPVYEDGQGNRFIGG